MQGKIKFFNEDKQFGFITAQDGKDYFYHSSNCISEITTASKNEKVSFETNQGKKGIEAVDVKIIS